MKILCIGDSNTWGYDPRSYYGSRYPADARWTDQLDDYTVVNCGMNGLSIPQNAAVYKELIKSRKPDLTIVMLGSSDLLERASAAIIADCTYVNKMGQWRVRFLHCLSILRDGNTISSLALLPALRQQPCSAQHSLTLLPRLQQWSLLQW